MTVIRPDPIRPPNFHFEQSALPPQEKETSSTVKKLSIYLQETHRRINDEERRRYEETLAKHGISTTPLTDFSGNPEKGSYGRIFVGKEGKIAKVIASSHQEATKERLIYAQNAWKEHALNEQLTREKAPHTMRQYDACSNRDETFVSIQERGGENLDDIYLNPKNPQQKQITMAEIRSIARQLLEILHHLHTPNPEFGRERSISHFDLKPHNILMNKEGQVSLIDFGIAEFVTEEGSNPLKYSRPYRPLESIIGNPPSLSADIWALGCTLFELAAGKYLIPVLDDQHQNPDAQMLHAYEDRLKPQKFPDGLMEFLHNEFHEKFFERNAQGHYSLKNRTIPRLRPYGAVIRQGCGNGMETEALIDLLDQMLQLNPLHRKSAEELLKHRFFMSDELRTDTQFSIASAMPNLAVRISTLDGTPLLTVSLSDPPPCCHVPRLDQYRLELYHPDDPRTILDTQERDIPDGGVIDFSKSSKRGKESDAHPVKKQRGETSKSSLTHPRQSDETDPLELA